MKRAVAFLLVVVAGAAGLYFSQRLPNPTPVSPSAVLGMVAETQRDTTRIPMRFTRLSDAEEVRIGNQLADHYVTPSGEFSTLQLALQCYAQTTGGVLAAHTHRSLPYQFHLIPQKDFVNAFAVPGGHVFIGEGLLDQSQTEDELANVLAHEIEHIDHYHCAERVQLEAQVRKLRLGDLAEVLQIPLEAWETGYRKTEEAEADREGMMLATTSGYSPYGTITLLRRLSRVEDDESIQARTPGQEMSQLALQILSGYSRSHPLTSERLSQAETLIAQQHWQNRQTQKPFSVEYTVKRSGSMR